MVWWSWCSPEAVLRAVPGGFAFQRKLDETVDQLGVRHPAGFPEFGIHANAGETGYRVDFIEYHLAGVLFEEEVCACHAGTVNRFIGSRCQLSDIFGSIIRDGSRDEQFG